MRIVIFALMAAFAALSTQALASPHYRVADSINVADDGWDFASVDPETNQLFIARRHGVTAINLQNDQVNNQLVQIDSAHAVLPIPGSGAILVTEGYANGVRLVDARTGATRWSLPTGKRPDAALWDEQNHQAIILHKQAGTIALVDVANAKVTARYEIAPGMENAALDKHGVLWVNSYANNLTPVDMRTGQVMKMVPQYNCKESAGLVYARKFDQILSVCTNGNAFVVDAHRRRLIFKYDICKGADSVMVDEKRGVIAVPCREGIMQFFHYRGAAIGPDGHIVTEPGARTGAIDPATGTIYLPTARFLPREANEEYSRQVPNSVHILKVVPTHVY